MVFRIFSWLVQNSKLCFSDSKVGVFLQLLHYKFWFCVCVCVTLTRGGSFLWNIKGDPMVRCAVWWCRLMMTKWRWVRAMRWRVQRWGSSHVISCNSQHRVCKMSPGAESVAHTLPLCGCVCVCVRERERERETNVRESNLKLSLELIIDHFWYYKVTLGHRTRAATNSQICSCSKLNK